MNKTIPFSKDAEKAVLCSCLLDSVCIKLIDLQTDEFFSRENQNVFKAMITLDAQNKEIDIVSVNEITNNFVYLSELVQSTASPANIQTYADIVRDKSNRRRAIQTASEMAKSAYDENEDFVAGEFTTKIMNIERGRMEDADMKDSIKSFDDWLETRISMRNDGAIENLPKTHFPNLDKILINLEPQQMTIIAGEPGVGKTMFCQQIVEQNNQTGRIIFSLEMSSDRLVGRMVSARSGVPVTAMRLGLPNDEGKLLKQIRDTYSYFENQKMFLRCKSSMTIENMYSEIARIQARGNEIGLVVVDYFGLINEKTVTSNAREREDIKSQKLQRMWRELGVHGLVIDTYNKNQFGQKKGSLGGIYGSVGKVYDADNVITLTKGDVTIGGTQIFCDAVKSRDSEMAGGRVVLMREHGKPIIREMTNQEAQNIIEDEDDDDNNYWHK